MNRRDLLRNTLLTIGAAAVNRPAEAREFAPGDNASVELARAGWKPVFLDAHQNETLIVLSDAILPGAKEALVNRFLDLVLSSESFQIQHKFLGSLAYLDAAAMERYKVAFLYLTPAERDDFLNLLAYSHMHSGSDKTDEAFIGYQHFTELKAWISRTYYSSPTGLRELGWDGSAPAGFFAGCEHSPGGHDQGN